jgi:hypothetical protein
MAFSRTGSRLFAGSGQVVYSKASGVTGRAAALGAITGGAAGMVVGAAVGAAVEKLGEFDAQLELHLVTALRCWDLDRGKMTADLTDLSGPHPNGIGGVYFWPWGSTAATVGESAVHAWDLGTGAYLGQVHEVSDPRALSHVAAPAVERVEFTHDGTHALILEAGGRNLLVVPWPQPPA